MIIRLSYKPRRIFKIWVEDGSFYVERSRPAFEDRIYSLEEKGLDYYFEEERVLDCEEDVA